MFGGSIWIFYSMISSSVSIFCKRVYNYIKFKVQTNWLDFSKLECCHHWPWEFTFIWWYFICWFSLSWNTYCHLTCIFSLISGLMQVFIVSFSFLWRLSLWFNNYLEFFYIMWFLIKSVHFILIKVYIIKKRRHNC